jgi:hypothetical protein
VLHQRITTIIHLSSHLRHPSPVSTSSLSPSCNFPFPFFISSATIWLLLDFIFSALLLRLLLLFCFFVTTCWVQTAPKWCFFLFWPLQFWNVKFINQYINCLFKCLSHCNLSFVNTTLLNYTLQPYTTFFQIFTKNCSIHFVKYKV